MNSGDKSTNEYIIKFFTSLFSHKLPKPNPAFPRKFMNQVPNITCDINEISDVLELQSKLHLTLECRNPIVDFLITEPEQINSSQDNKYYTSILSIQSICALFYAFDNRDSYIEHSQFNNFLKCLHLSYVLMPSNINYIYSILLILFKTMINELHDINLPSNNFLTLIEFLSSLDSFLLFLIQTPDSSEKPSIDLINLLVSLSCIVIDHLDLESLNQNNQDNKELYNLFKNHITVTTTILSQIHPTTENEELNEQTLSIFEKFANITQKLNSITQRVQMWIQILIGLCVELSNLTEIEFRQIDSYVKLFVNEESEALITENSEERSFEENEKKLNQTLSMIANDYFEQNVQYNQILSTFDFVSSKFHLFSLLFAENSFLANNIEQRPSIWALYLLILNNHILTSSLPSFKHIQLNDKTINEQKEIIKSLNVLFRYLAPKRFFSISIFERETILELKIISSKVFFDLLKKLKRIDDELLKHVYYSIRNYLMVLFEFDFNQFYENLVLFENIFENMTLTQFEPFEINNQLFTSLSNSIKKFSDNEKEKLLPIFERIINNESFIIASTNQNDCYELFLNTQNAKLIEDFFIKIINFVSLFPESTDYKAISMFIQNSGKLKNKIVEIINFAVKSCIYNTTMNSYFNNTPNTNSKIMKTNKLFIKSIFKSPVVDVLISNISTDIDIVLFLDFLSSSVFITSNSNHFTFSAPSIYQLQSENSFLFINNNNTFNNNLLANFNFNSNDSVPNLNEISKNLIDSKNNYVDWTKVCDKLINLKLTKEIYVLLLKIISEYATFNVSDNYDVENITDIFLRGINNPNAIPLLKIILNSDEFNEQFLLSFNKLVKNNIIEAIKLFKFGGILILLQQIKYYHSNNSPNLTNLTNLIFEIVVYVITFICDKETTEQFQRTFFELKVNQIEAEKVFIEYFKQALTNNPLYTSNYLNFNSIDSLVFLSPIAYTHFDTGISFVMELLIPTFDDRVNCLLNHLKYSNNDEIGFPVLYIASENVKSDLDSKYQFFIISLFKNKIEVNSNLYPTTLEILIDIPQNEWFTLSISIKSWSQIKIQIITEKNSKQSVHTKLVQTTLSDKWNLNINRIEMFNISFFSPPELIKLFKSKLRIDGLIRHIMIFVDDFSFDINNENNDIACKYQKQFAHFTPQYSCLPETKFENLMSNHEYSIILLNSEPNPLQIEQFVSTFVDYFTKFSHGLCEFVIYFSKENLSEDEIILLFDTLKYLFETFPSLQKQMLEFQGFHLLPHLLNTRQNLTVNDIFFDKILELESCIADEVLLNQFRSNCILNFEQYRKIEDNNLICRILKKWKKFDSSFLRSHISFSKFCFNMYHQFAERKYDSNIRNLMISIIVSNSQYLEKQDLYLLTQLAQRISQTDVSSALTLIQGIHVITKDKPDILNIVQKGLIEMVNKPPELLATIVQLFDTDDEYTKRLLFIEMNQNRSEKQKIEYIRCFSNFLIASNHDYSFEELLHVEAFNVVAINLFPFILSFGFDCNDEVVSFIVKFFNNIFSIKEETVKLLTNSIGKNSITLFIFVAFSVFKCHDMLQILFKLICDKISLLADSLRIIDILALYLKREFTDFQSLILNTLLLKILDKQFHLTGLNDLIDVIINFICFGPNRSIFDRISALNKTTKKPTQKEEIKFSLVEFFKAFLEYPIAIATNEYGLSMNALNQWNDLKTVELLMLFIGHEDLNEQINKKLLILFTFLINEHSLCPIQKICQIFTKIEPFYNDYKCLMIPFYIRVVNNADVNFGFVQSFRITTAMIDEFNEIFKNFVNELHEISNVGERLLVGLTMKSLEIEEKVTLDEAFADVQQKEITLKTLREKIFRRIRPIYYPIKNCRRFNLFDNHFRPYLLTNNERIKFPQIDSPVFNDNTLGSGESSLIYNSELTNILWSAPCQRIKIDQTFDGYFSVTTEGYRFITPKGKSYNLLKNSIQYVFWNYCNNEPLSFTFFLANGKCFLFRFFKPETRESIISKLNLVSLDHCSYFQSNHGYEELGRLKLTEKWRDRSITNFDYLMWLNLLSGRTFLDPDYYPIFPLMFISDINKWEMRDFSQNIIFMSPETLRKWKQTRLSFDPYEHYLLDQSFSTQKVVCTFLDGIDQFRKRENEDSVQIHHKHLFYSAFDDLHDNENKVDYRSTNEKYVLNVLTKTEMKKSKSIDILPENITKTKKHKSKDIIDVNENMKELQSFNKLINGLKKSTVHTELIPEFFFLPEVFKIWQDSVNDGEIEPFPLWAPDSSRYILEHTIAIESEEVSMKLHKWIDLIWGSRQNHYIYNPHLSFNCDKHVLEKDNYDIEGHLPPILFTGPHPARTPMPMYESTTTSIPFELNIVNDKKDGKIDFQSIINEFFINNNNNNDGFNNICMPQFNNSLIDPSTLNYKFQYNADAIEIEAAAQHERMIIQMTKSEKVIPIAIGLVDMKTNNVYILFSNEIVIQLPTKDEMNLTYEIKERLSIQNLSKINLNYGDLNMFSFSQSVLFFVPLGLRSVFCFDFRYNKLFTTGGTSSHLSAITCLDSFENYVVSGSNDTSIVCWLLDPRGISIFKSLLVHSKPIKYLRIIDKMKIMLAVDTSGHLSISMFPNLKLIKMIDFDFQPDFVDMTKCCLVAISKSKVESFTSNGVKIAERIFRSFQIICETAVEVVTRSDVIAIATSTNEVLLLNCVSLEIVGMLAKLESKAQLMKFDENCGTVVIVTEKNEVLFVQIPD